VVDRRQGRLAVARAALSAVSPLATLARGFAIVRDGDGRLIRAVNEARPGATITIQVSDGTFRAQVTG
jgi:exodeoxyribonuclease VII large subunit